MCDRVLVMRDGSVVAEVAREELSEARLVREGLGRRRTAAPDPHLPAGNDMSDGPKTKVRKVISSR